MAQSVTTLSPLIKHGSWAGGSIQSAMLKNAMRVKAFRAALNLHVLAARRILGGWSASFGAWASSLSARLEPLKHKPILSRARRNLASPLRGLTRSRSLRYLAGRCMIDSRKLASLLRAPAMSQSIGSTDRREPRRVVGRLPSDLVEWPSDPRVARRPMSRRCKDPLRALTGTCRRCGFCWCGAISPNTRQPYCGYARMASCPCPRPRVAAGSPWQNPHGSSRKWTAPVMMSYTPPTSLNSPAATRAPASVSRICRMVHRTLASTAAES